MFCHKSGNRPLIITSLRGGLGNQMFQYACGRALALRLGVELLLDLSWFEHIGEGGTERHFQLNAFPHGVCKLASKEEIRSFTFSRRSFLDMLLRRPVARSESYIQEPSFAYWSGIEDVHAPAYLAGYWQNERYFTAYADVIRQDFTFPELPSGEAKDMARRLLAEPHAVSVHIRRGDYVSNPVARDVLGVCSREYYRRALARIGGCIEGGGHIFLFSDEPAWGRENFEADCPITVVNCHSHIASPWNDMHLMSLCRHHVIANSSFSWWAAWLSTQRGVTIAPLNWFTGESMRHFNPSASSWIQL